VNAPWITVQLPPATAIRLTARLRRFAHPATYRFPFASGAPGK
jgi:hypothetical protein